LPGGLLLGGVFWLLVVLDLLLFVLLLDLLLFVLLLDFSELALQFLLLFLLLVLDLELLLCVLISSVVVSKNSCVFLLFL